MSSGAMTASAVNRLRVGGVPEHFNLPWHLALESGAAADCGMAVQWQEYSTGTGAMLADLAADQLDIAVMLTEGVALGLARGLPIHPVSLYTTTPLIWGIHVRPSLDAATIESLRGCPFAISRPGSGSHLMTLALALEQQWPVSELDFVVVDNLPGAIRAFGENRADAFLWEHFTTQPKVDSGEFRRVGNFLSPWPAWVICASAAGWQAHRATIRRLLGIVAEAAAKLRQADDCAAVIANRYGLQPAEVARWLEQTEWVTAPVSAGEALAAAHVMLTTAGAI